jgi:hypothetical protein
LSKDTLAALRAVVQGLVNRVAVARSRLTPVADVATAERVLAANGVRSISRVGAAVRSAKGILAMAADRGVSTELSAEFEPASLASEVDAALCMWVHARTRSAANVRAPASLTRGEPSTVETEGGALITTLRPLLPVGEDWPLYRAAKESVGCSDRRRGPGKKTVYAEIPPARVCEWLLRSGPCNIKSDASGARDQAAVAFAALGGGIPLGVTRGMRPHDVELSGFRAVWDSAFVATYTGARKVIRKRARASTTSTTFAAASPLFPLYFSPWVRHAQAEGWTWLFPDLDRTGNPVRANRVGEDHLRVLSKNAADDQTVTHHCFRVGTARALKYAHRRPDGPALKVEREVANQLQLRSNEGGSFQIYDEGDAEAAWSASWPLYGVRWLRAGPAMTTFVNNLPVRTGAEGQPSRLGGMMPCGVCKAELAPTVPAWGCDDCEVFVVCTTCSPANPGDISCPEHKL